MTATKAQTTATDRQPARRFGERNVPPVEVSPDDLPGDLAAFRVTAISHPDREGNRTETAHTVIVNRDDARLFRAHRWNLNGGARPYIGATIDGRKEYLHRQILDAPKGRLVDHINGDPLDCRRENLRIVTRSENALNRVPVHAKSGYKGVETAREGTRAPRWRAMLYCGGKRHCGRWRRDPVQAAHDYDAFVREHCPDFGTVNFPRDGERGADIRPPTTD